MTLTRFLGGIVQYPTFFVFGLVIAVAGIVQFLTRKRQGEYAYRTWKSWGAEGMAQSPEFWAKVSVPINIVFVLIGAGLMIASFLPLVL
jgi:hypothetical protein